MKDKKYTKVIPVDDNTKEAFTRYCKDLDLKQSQAVRKLMKEKGYLNKDGSLKKER